MPLKERKWLEDENGIWFWMVMAKERDDLSLIEGFIERENVTKTLVTSAKALYEMTTLGRA